MAKPLIIAIDFNAKFLLHTKKIPTAHFVSKNTLFYALDPMQDYKCPRVAAIICSGLVNTHTHTQTAFNRLYAIISAR